MTFITKSTVLDRGWTQGAIEKWLGEPDKYAPNPYSRRKPPMNLFEKARVLKAEQRPDFLAWMAKSQIARSKISAKMLEKHQEKRDALLKFLDSVTIPVAEMAIPRLEARAKAHFDELKWARNWDYDSDTTLERKCVNYLRHRCSPYDAKLQEMFCNFHGETGNGEIYTTLKIKVLKTIAEKYEFLKDECQHQMESLQ